MRVVSWEKQRQQVLDWVGSSFSDLQLLPEDVRQQTEVLMEADLLTVDSSGALSVGLWSSLPGPRAERKSAEFDKFAQVEAWVDALLQLTAPVLGASDVISGGGMSSGVAGAGAGGAASSGPAGAAGSGGGVLTGTAGASGAPGIGTVAAAGSAPVTTVSGALAGASGLGAGVLSGTAGATTGLGMGTAATVFPTPAAVVDPNAIAAAIANALRTRLDALGSRIASLEARGVAPAGAPLLGGGVPPPEAELLARALRDLVATAEGWDVTRCSQACADLLAAEECELDELPAGKEATQEHWRAFVHLLQARVSEFQQFVKAKVPSFQMSDVMVASFFRKRKHVHGDSDEEEARAAGGGSARLPPLDAARREQLAALGSSFRTVNEDQLARALRGELAPEDIVRPPGAGAPSSAIPAPGPLAGVNLLVQLPQRLQQEDEGRIKWKDGDLTVVPKTRKCKDMDEWERGFFRIMCEAPLEAREDLVDFLVWAKTIAADFTFYHFSEFYEHLIRQVQRSTVGISLEGHDRVPLRWEVERIAPLPDTQTSPDAWCSLEEPGRVLEDLAVLERVDRDDWMVCPVRWEELDQEFGPFTVDACVAESRANA
ncbi:hypothetical protein CYMTET_28684 [Cymbomonas tetramitiformis]|uniref:Uncharacterized protein n=1 Tax=Cymbomonas tetramitiformis TaxID=36881 RepID=A0AAE0FMG4_9CHLO|nr:hypothetical protein CYMTET_28684 [Cymbomonas tetramitiformis]